MQPMGFPSQDWGTSQDFVGTQSPLGTAMPFLQQPKIHGLPVPPSMPRLSAPRPRSGAIQHAATDWHGL